MHDRSSVSDADYATIVYSENAFFSFQKNKNCDKAKKTQQHFIIFFENFSLKRRLTSVRKLPPR